MTGPIEAIPNISEGRRRPVIDGAVDRMARHSRARLLDVTSDPDHNRTVLTLAGNAGEVRDALLALFEAAIEAIDMRRHRGVHPRVGAVDVVPLVPLAGTTMDRCVALARQLGAEIADRFSIPVYLYERAAPGPGRAALETIRAGEFERFAAKIDRDGWVPDFGPRRVHPTAGVTVVGARPPLIAFNIDLATADVAIARQVARSIRARDGGLPCVKAIGVYLESRQRAQIATNLVDYRRTPVQRVFERARSEAERLGAAIAGCEIIGLVPRDALPDERGSRLQLENFGPDRILENLLGIGPAGPEESPGG